PSRSSLFPYTTLFRSYSPRKQYLPMSVGVTAPEVALDVNVLGLPSETSVCGLPATAVPPVSQVPVAMGPQTKKLTVPVGSPPAADRKSTRLNSSHQIT